MEAFFTYSKLYLGISHIFMVLSSQFFLLYRIISRAVLQKIAQTIMKYESR